MLVNQLTVKEHNIYLNGIHNGKRLELIPLRVEHLDKIAQWKTDMDILIYSELVNEHTRDKELIKKVYSFMSERVTPFFMIYDGVPIGECWVQKMTMPEIYFLHPDEKVMRIKMNIGEKEYWNKGIGSFALSLLCDYAFSREGADVIYCIAFDFNIRGRKCALKAGFEEVGKMPTEREGEADFEHVFMMKKKMFYK